MKTLAGIDYDRSFFSTLLRLMLPIALQQLIVSALNVVSIMMIGQLGETSLAAVGLANQVFFLFQLLLFGVGTGSAIFVAQFWGTRDIANIRRVLIVCLGIALLGAAFFTSIALLLPQFVLGIYSTDPNVITLGGDYLRVVGLAYGAVAITTSYAITLRSTGNVRLPVSVSIFSLGLGALLNYALIFGQLGLPALGVHGAAIGTAAARFLECGLLLSFVYAGDSPATARIRDLKRLDSGFLLSILKTVLPVTANEILWSLGISAYSLIYGRMGTESIAAVSIAMTIENLALVPFVGSATACAIMIGHRIGADQEQEAFDCARRFMLLTLAAGIVVGGAIFIAADFALGFYRISDVSFQLAKSTLTVMSAVLCIKASNMLFIVGILRAGGDTRASLIIDVGPLWLIGIPSAVFGAFALRLPAHWVYLLAMSDEVCKFITAAFRVFSGRWINNLARQHTHAGLAE